MSKIRIKNFGPIKEGFREILPGNKENTWMDVKKVTVFIGNQGSGKSVVAKLISTFTWIEKALTRGDYNIKHFTSYNRFKKTFCAYHRLENYFIDEEGKDISELAYQGDRYIMYYKDGKLNIDEMPASKYVLPQIMYVPAERNFITYVKTPKELKLSSDSLKEFLTEFDNAKDEMKGVIKLPINNVDIEYDRLNDTMNLRGEGYKVKLTEASSGFQSLVPLYLVSAFLAHSVKKQSEESKETMSSEELERFRRGVKEIWSNENLTEEQRRAALSVLSAKFNKAAFINIVEEPEQNLFPSSQKEMLYSLLEHNNMNEDNKLIITTHSPYLINYLTLAVEAGKILPRIIDKELVRKLNDKIIPSTSTIAKEDLVVYELDEKKGTIEKLKDYEGLPSDKNYLNKGLVESNDLFSELLDIEDLCQ